MIFTVYHLYHVVFVAYFSFVFFFYEQNCCVVHWEMFFDFLLRVFIVQNVILFAFLYRNIIVDLRTRMLMQKRRMNIQSSKNVRIFCSLYDKSQLIVFFFFVFHFSNVFCFRSFVFKKFFRVHNNFITRLRKWRNHSTMLLLNEIFVINVFCIDCVRWSSQLSKSRYKSFQKH